MDSTGLHSRLSTVCYFVPETRSHTTRKHATGTCPCDLQHAAHTRHVPFVPRNKVRDFVAEYSIPQELGERLLDHAYLAHERPSLMQIWPLMPPELFVEAKHTSFGALVRASRCWLPHQSPLRSFCGGCFERR